MAKFTVYTDKHEQFRWRFKASNDQVVAKSSEGYGRKEDCLQALSLLQRDIAGAAVTHKVKSKAGGKALGAPGVAATAAAPRKAAQGTGTPAARTFPPNR